MISRREERLWKLLMSFLLRFLCMKPNVLMRTQRFPNMLLDHQFRDKLVWIIIVKEGLIINLSTGGYDWLTAWKSWARDSFFQRKGPWRCCHAFRLVL